MVAPTTGLRSPQPQSATGPAIQAAMSDPGEPDEPAGRKSCLLVLQVSDVSNLPSALGWPVVRSTRAQDPPRSVSAAVAMAHPLALLAPSRANTDGHARRPMCSATRSTPPCERRAGTDPRRRGPPVSLPLERDEARARMWLLRALEAAAPTMATPANPRLHCQTRILAPGPSVSDLRGYAGPSRASRPSLTARREFGCD